MDATFIPIEIVPSKTPFGLDQLRRSYKSSLSATDAIAAAPAVGDADETFPFMFLMPITTPESSESATRIDLVYMGSMTTGDSPVLPDPKQTYSSPIQTASSTVPMSGIPATSPLTLEYLAQISNYVFWTYLTPGTVGTGPEPILDPVIRSLTAADANYAPGNIGLDQVIANFFQLRETDTIENSEIVPGKYWQNTEQVTLFYGAPVFATATDGNHFIAVYNPGRGFTASDSVSFTGGSITVDQIGARGAITAISFGSATFTNTTFVILDGSGGTGTGSRFVTIYIP